MIPNSRPDRVLAWFERGMHTTPDYALWTLPVIAYDSDGEALVQAPDGRLVKPRELADFMNVEDNDAEVHTANAITDPRVPTP